MQVGAISHSISDLEGCTGSGSEARANPSSLSACTRWTVILVLIGACCQLPSSQSAREEEMRWPCRSDHTHQAASGRGGGSLIASPLSPGHRSSSASQHAGRKSDSSPAEHMNGGPSHQPPFFFFLFFLFFGGLFRRKEKTTKVKVLLRKCVLALVVTFFSLPLRYSTVRCGAVLKCGAMRYSTA